MMRTSLLCALAMVFAAGVVHGQAYYPGPSAAPTGFGQRWADYNVSSRPASYDPNAALFQCNGFLNTPVPPPCENMPAAPPCPPMSSVSAASVEDPDDQEETPTKHRFWIGAGYSALFIKPERVNVPLVTTGSLADANPGAIGQPGTVVHSSDQFNFGMISAMQADAGIFLDSSGSVALQWAGLFAFPTHVRYRLASDATGNPLIARPLFNANAGINQSLIDSFPGQVAGSFNLDARSQIFGTETNLVGRYWSGESSHFDLLGGFRYLRLAEDLTILDQLTPLNAGFLTFETGPANPPNFLADMDRFTTRNNFYGAQLGGLYTLEGERWFLSAFGKAGLGATNQYVNINGSTALVTPTGRQFAGGGVLALPTNMGVFSRNVLGFVPEGGLTIGRRLGEHAQLTMGYSFLYWNSVVRPGGQLNASANPTQIPTTIGYGTATGPAIPQFQFVPETFWMHNVNCGLTIHF